MALGLATVTGCETKGWIDPTEMGRFEKENPALMRPILDNLASGYEEQNDQFLNATDPKPP